MNKKITKMFMAHIPIKDMSNVVSTLLEYSSVSNYIVCGETTPYEHIHYLVEMDDLDYKRYAKRVFIDGYKLRGQAGRKGTIHEGKPRQYGKVKEIQDIENAISYTLKEGNEQMRYTNMNADEIEKYIAKSFKKEERKPKIEKWLDDNKTYIEDMYIHEQSEKWLDDMKDGNGMYRMTFDNMRYSMLRIFSKMRKDLGHIQGIRKLFYDGMLKSDFISMEHYCAVIYRM